jgi:hypothetical protein
VALEAARNGMGRPQTVCRSRIVQAAISAALVPFQKLIEAKGNMPPSDDTALLIAQYSYLDSFTRSHLSGYIEAWDFKIGIGNFGTMLGDSIVK